MTHLTRAEAAANYPELGQLIGERFEPSRADQSIKVLDTTTGNTLGAFTPATEEDVDRAIAAAAQGHKVWSKMSAVDRARILRKTADTIRERSDEIAALCVLELGKPFVQAKAEVEQAAGMWEWAAEEGRRAYGRIIPSRVANSRSMVTVEPLGPIAAFSSWNAPLTTPSRKMAAALGAGCSLVLKAASETSACALALGKIAYESGLPDGALSILIGKSAMISEKMLSSNVFHGTTFTGSTSVGILLATQAVQTMKRPIMELGGHAPVLVFDDVDVAKTSALAATAKYRNSGQICTSPTRFFVQKAIYEEFVEGLVKGAQSQVLGCGFEPETTMGPLAHARRVTEMNGMVTDAENRGHRVFSGGQKIDLDGFFFEPTIIADATTETLISNEEPFGPIAAVTPFETYDEAIALANRLPFALASYVQTSNVTTINRAIDDIEAGNVIGNGWQVSLPETPFGGHKMSGLGMEGGIEGIQAFQKIKYATVA